MINEIRKNEYGCSMVYFDLPFIDMIHEYIDEKDIYEDPNDPSYGLEDEPHVTLLFGLHDNVDDEDVFDLSTPKEITPITLKNIGCFESQNGYNVLKFEAEADWLGECNEKLTELPHTSNFQDYKPHCTISYMINGKCDKYIDILKGVEIKVEPKELVYSKPSGQKIKRSIKDITKD